MPRDFLASTIILLAIVSAMISGCATNPVTGKQDFVLMSEADELNLGKKYHQQIIQTMKPYKNQALDEYVNRVGQRIGKVSHRPELDYHFTVVDDAGVNAFALPGGYIYITRGLLAFLNSEAELAAVLGHEVGHVTARHSVRQQSAATATGVAGVLLEASTGVRGSRDLFSILGKAALSGYGRDHELESDRLGAQYLAKAGYDPQAMLEVIGVLKNQEIYAQQKAREEGRKPRAYHGLFASHPDNDRRLQEVVGEADKLKKVGESENKTRRREFLQQLSGLAYGTGEDEGLISGRNFYHKPLDFGLAFPKNWQIRNHADRLLAVAPGSNAFVEISVQPISNKLSPLQFMRDKGLKNITRGTALSLRSFPSYTATAPVKTQWGQRNARVSAIIDHQHAYLMIGVSKGQSSSRALDNSFVAIANSFHKLTRQEKNKARGKKLELIKANRSTRFAKLAQSSSLSDHAEEQLRLLNDFYPSGEPGAGQTLKIVR